VYVPKAKPQSKSEARPTRGMALDEMFEDSPLYTLVFLLFQQVKAIESYHCTHILTICLATWIPIIPFH